MNTKNKEILITSDVFIVRDNTVLFLWHEKAGLWLAPGGKRENHETLQQTAVREALEETGLYIELRDSSFEKDRISTDLAQELVNSQGSFLINTKFGETQHDFCFFATVVDDRQEGCGEYKTSGMKWCTVWDLEQMDLQPDIKKYALKALDVLGSR